MKKTVIVGTDRLLKAAERLLERGEITKKQFLEMCRRNRVRVPEDWKKDTITLR